MHDRTGGENRGGFQPGSREIPGAAQLRALVDKQQFAEAAALVDGIDLAALDAEAQYLAGVAFGSLGRLDAAVDLLKSAAERGFAAFWCAYHLGIFERRRGRIAPAAYYFAISLILRPDRTDIRPLLARVAPGLDPGELSEAASRGRPGGEPQNALTLGILDLEAGNPGKAACRFLTALLLDPGNAAARARLCEIAPEILLTLAPGLCDTSDASGASRTARHATAEEAPTELAERQVGGLPPGSRKPPPAIELEQLANSNRHAEAVALLDGVDLSADLLPDFLYLAGVCFGAVGRAQLAIDLLKRALLGGYARFWCAYHLGLFEERQGNRASAAAYYTTSLILEPARSDILELLKRVAPETDLSLLREAQSGKTSVELAGEAFRRGQEARQAGKPELAACNFAVALVLDPLLQEARSRLLEVTPGFSLEVMSGIDFDRLSVELEDKLEQPEAGEVNLERKLAIANWAATVYFQTAHPSGYELIPALERVFRRALRTGEVSLDSLCMLYSAIYFLYFYMAARRDQMRGFADRVTKPFAAAIREGAISSLPLGGRQRLGPEPLGIAYLSQYARLDLGNAVGPFAHFVLGGLAQYFPGRYRLALYAWDQFDEPSVARMQQAGVLVRRFEGASMAAKIGAVAEAAAADGIDILLTDQNSWLPTVLFERRIAPIQIQYNVGGLSFWPLENLDAVFRIDVDDPALDGFAIENCFPLGLGPWDLSMLAPPVDPVRVAEERRRFPEGVRLIGNYGRLAKITPEFLAIQAELLARHRDLVIVLGGIGDSRAIREFAEARGLAGRLIVVEEFVDGQVWGHMLEIFVDTFPSEGGVARREVMAKGRPVVTMQSWWAQFDAVPTLIASTREAYVDIVSRLLTDPDSYASACAATREFVETGMNHADYSAAVHDALAALVSRTRRAQNDPVPRTAPT